MATRGSVNRPPTPEPEESDEGEEGEQGGSPARLPLPVAVPDAARSMPKPKPLSVQELVEIKLIRSGKKERLKELLRRRLVDCGWRDKLKSECRAYIKKVGRDSVSTNDLVRYLTPKGRALVPGPVKAELLREIQDFLQP